MNHRTTIRSAAALLLTLAGSGCSYIETVNHYALDAAQLQRYSRMRILDDTQRAAGDYRSLGVIRGLSCTRNGAGPANEQEAMDQLLLRASLAGGDAVFTPSCVHSGATDWNNNCWSSVICEAEVLAERSSSPPPKEPAPRGAASEP